LKSARSSLEAAKGSMKVGARANMRAWLPAGVTG
jgi:hypothetical protein